MLCFYKRNFVTDLYCDMCFFSPENEVSVCTQEGHVLIHNLSINVTTTLLDNSTLVSVF